MQGQTEVQDQRILCGDCGQPFIFTGGESCFYASKGLRQPPKRCPACREARKWTINRREGTG